jgi:hypothetical protein
MGGLGQGRDPRVDGKAFPRNQQTNGSPIGVPMSSVPLGTAKTRPVSNGECAGLLSATFTRTTLPPMLCLKAQVHFRAAARSAANCDHALDRWRRP